MNEAGGGPRSRSARSFPFPFPFLPRSVALMNRVCLLPSCSTALLRRRRIVSSTYLVLSLCHIFHFFCLFGTERFLPLFLHRPYPGRFRLSFLAANRGRLDMQLLDQHQHPASVSTISCSNKGRRACGTGDLRPGRCESHRSGTTKLSSRCFASSSTSHSSFHPVKAHFAAWQSWPPASFSLAHLAEICTLRPQRHRRPSASSYLTSPILPPTVDCPKGLRPSIVQALPTQ